MCTAPRLAVPPAPTCAHQSGDFLRSAGAILISIGLVRTAIDPTVYRLLKDVAEGIRVLQSRDGVALTEQQIHDRACNIVMGLIGNYRIELLDGDTRGDREPFGRWFSSELTPMEPG